MSRFTVPITEVALERVPGEPTRVLPPGRYRTRRLATYQTIDVRPRLQLLPPQEVLTADRVTVKVSATIAWTVADPVAFTETVAEPLAVVYLAVQVALREALVATPVEDVPAQVRRLVTEASLAAGREAGGPVGIDVQDVTVKDVVLPYELREAYAELVAGRQRAQVQLEAARAETAALRSLANGAKLLEEHPALARVRLVQALPAGSTVKLDAE